MTTDLFLLSSGASVVATESVELGGSSFETRNIPEDTKLTVLVTNVGINERKEGANYIEEENIGFDLLVTEKGEFFDFEHHQKLRVNELKPVKDKKLIAKGILTTADKAKTTLMTYDAISGGELSKAAAKGQDPYDVGTLSRSFTGLELTATFGCIKNTSKKFKQNPDTKEWDIPDMEDDGVTQKEITRYTNWIKGIEPKNTDAVKTNEDAAIMKQAQNQPNAPVIDPVPMVAQPVAAIQATTVPVAAQAQAAAQGMPVDDLDIPF